MTQNKKKATKTKSKKEIVQPGPSHEFNLDRFKNMVIVALIAIIIGISTAFFIAIFNAKKRIEEEASNCSQATEPTTVVENVEVQASN